MKLRKIRCSDRQVRALTADGVTCKWIQGHGGAMDILLRPKEAALRLGITVTSLQHWDRQGRKRVVRTLGDLRRIPLSEVERLMGERNDRLSSMPVFPPTTRRRTSNARRSACSGLTRGRNASSTSARVRSASCSASR